MLLSVVIVNWNTRELLDDCLASLAEQDLAGPWESWVVDNNSTDGSVEYLRAHHPDVRLIASPRNLGFAAANNLAIGASSSKYVLLLNPDTRLYPRALERLVRFMEANTDHAAAGPRILNPDGSLQVSSYPNPTLFREFWRMFHLDRIRPLGAYPMQLWDTSRPRQVDTLLGACLLMRRSVLDDLGPLDDQFFIYSEEIDLCYRMRKAGWQISWVPDAQIVHYGGQSTGQVAEAMFLNLYRSKVRFFRKHYGRLRAQAYKLVLYGAAGTRLLLSPLSKTSKHRQLAERYRALLLELHLM